MQLSLIFSNNKLFKRLFVAYKSNITRIHGLQNINFLWWDAFIQQFNRVFSLPAADSDDEEIHYRDESALAAKVQRQDSLARFLSQRPRPEMLIEKNILHMQSEQERNNDRAIIGNRLNR